MDYLQYLKYYFTSNFICHVLNLVINGLPSIPPDDISKSSVLSRFGFKPCYKWTTFNTATPSSDNSTTNQEVVLNLVINGLPSILKVHLFI